MTTAVSQTSPSGLTLSQAAQQAAAANLGAASATGSASSSGSTSAASLSGTNALQSLGANFTSFLSLLTTQLRNQDPTSPMDTDTFTQELVSFTGVQQSVATNSNLSTLISLTQGASVLQSANVVGDTVNVNANEMALQNGTGSVSFSLATAQPVQVAIVSSSGQDVFDGTLDTQAGSNSWTWNGRDNDGNKMPDGAYGVALETGGSGSTASPVSFTMLGTATGLTNSSSGLLLDVGAVQVPLSSVISLQH